MSRHLPPPFTETQKISEILWWKVMSRRTLAFFTAGEKLVQRAINPLKLKGNVLWNNEDSDYTLEGWLAKIKHASFVITDSFHCMVMCLKLHTPFAVVTELEGNTGMNDRLYTLLGLLDMEDRIVYKDDIVKLSIIIDANIHRDGVDEKLEDYKSIGTRFLQSI